MIDPVFSLIVSYAAAAVLLHGAWHKWQERELFAAALQNYALIPEVAVPSASNLLIASEATIGFLLCIPMAKPIAQGAGFLLLLVVSAAVAVNLLRGRTEISCGCGGGSGDQQISWGLILRNSLFVLLLGLAALPTVARTLISIDYLIVGLGVAMLAGLYAAASQLLTNGPRLEALRNT